MIYLAVAAFENANAIARKNVMFGLPVLEGC